MEKDFRKMTLDQAVTWTMQTCKFDDVRKRIRSKAVAWILLKHITELAEYTKSLEAQIKVLSQQVGEEDESTRI